MRPPKRRQETPAKVEVPQHLLAFRPPAGTHEARMRAFRAWRAERAAFVAEHGLPRTWWWFWLWAPDAQRRFLDAGGTPPPRREVVDR